MWVTVCRIERDKIQGRLENEPAEPQKMREGDEVLVPLGDLNDRLCVIDGKPQGGFTMNAIAEITGQ